MGSFLVRELETEDATIFDKNPSPFFQALTSIGNVLNKDELAPFVKGLDAVVLLAAEHRDDVSPVSLYYDVNVQGTQNVLDAMDHAGVKSLLFTSSVAVYGLNKTNPDEQFEKDPFNHYGKSKWQAEQVIQAWYDKDPTDKSVTIIRPTVIFGERNRGNVFNLLRQISSGRFLMIGKGMNKKSMAYVGNVVAFIKHRLQKRESGMHIFNYVDKPDFTMTELTASVEQKLDISIPKIRIPYGIGILMGRCFDLLAFMTRRKLSISAVRVKKFCATTQFDATKAHASFNAPYSLKEGLDRTLEHEFINPKEDKVLFYSE